MKFHPLAQGHFDGPVIHPLPTGCQSRHQLPILVELHEVIEDIRRNPREVVGVCIHDVQFPPWPCDFFPHTAAAPSESEEHKDNATDDELFHGCSSLSPLSSRARKPSTVSPTTSWRVSS